MHNPRDGSKRDGGQNIFNFTEFEHGNVQIDAALVAGRKH